MQQKAVTHSTYHTAISPLGDNKTYSTMEKIKTFTYACSHKVAEDIINI